MDYTTHQDPLYRLIMAIKARTEFDHPVGEMEIVETHISYVLLTGSYAYKFKKPLSLGFLDFNTLEKRKFYCEEELRLNQRLAPELYLGVVTFTGNENTPELNGKGEIIEYAVKMIQFSREEELDKLLEKGQLKPAHLDRLVKQLYQFHSSIAVASLDLEFGEPEVIYRDVMDNFETIEKTITITKQEGRTLQNLIDWTKQEFNLLRDVFSARKKNGYIRECHGDLHLGNIALHNGEPLIFDCIEFSESLRWIDVMNELAFLIMDLDEKNQRIFSQRVLNAYLEQSGDYSGLSVFRFYLVYRAMVRCKVTCIRLGQGDLTDEERERAIENFRCYLELAETYTHSVKTALIITYGLSGSGKTTCTQALLEQLPAIRIRSDIERKRLHGMNTDLKTNYSINEGIYSASSSRDTYKKLAELARIILSSGYSVIVDATFLIKVQRKAFFELARALNIPFCILAFKAGEAELRRRIAQRQALAKDASEADGAVLDYQLSHQEPLDETETHCRMVIDAEREPPDLNAISMCIKQLAGEGENNR